MSTVVAEQELRTSSLEPQIWQVAELLGHQKLHIPNYQRPYKWTVRNVSQLIGDIIEFEAADRYRIGSVILHEQDGRLDIVDGQQRFLTLHLIARWLQGRVDLANCGLGPAGLPAVELGRSGLDTSVQNLRDNDAYLSEALPSRLPDQAAQESFARFLLTQCEVLVIRLNRLDEAFRMFDSQNTRGRALYPTDLLKAFHIREMSSDHVTPELRLQMVRLWEDIPSGAVNALFSDYLYKIKRWARGLPVSPQGFTTADIDLFKGIRESDPNNADNKWALPFLYAKNFTDDFRQENATLVRYRALRAIDYPFQLDHPVLNGETFFQMVAHYHQLAVQLGLFEPRVREPDTAATAPWREVIRQLDEFRTDSRLGLVRNLFDCLLLYYLDKFGEQEISPATTLLAKYCLSLRAELKQVTRQTVNNYALGRPSRPRLRAENLFAVLRETLRPADFIRRTIPAPNFPEPPDHRNRLARFFERPELESEVRQ